jgi:hypothetical protein
MRFEKDLAVLELRQQHGLVNDLAVRQPRHALRARISALACDCMITRKLALNWLTRDLMERILFSTDCGESASEICDYLGEDSVRQDCMERSSVKSFF